MEKTQVTIIGAGVVGLAIAAQLSKKYQSIIVLDKAETYGTEISSRNSEVIHAGIYYPPDSLKASLCIEGNQLLSAYCIEHNLPYNKIGKYIIATDTQEVEALDKLYENATTSGLDSLTYVTPQELKSAEPLIEAQSALFSPSTSICNVHELMHCLYNQALEYKVDFSFNTQVTNLEMIGSDYLVEVLDNDGDVFSFHSEIVINAAGLHSDKVAEMLGLDITQHDYNLHYCKGDYCLVQGSARKSLHHLIYPVPHPNLKGLGIHITLDVAGNMHLGPDAEYISRDNLSYAVADQKVDVFWNAVKRFFPTLEKNMLTPERSGIRPKLQGPREGFRDFIISEESAKGFPNFINLVGIESPGLTACLSIAKYIQQIIL